MRALASALVLAACIFGACPAAAAADARPNIVVIVADDWGYSDVGSYGSEIATPNLDALARQGVRFSNFHVSAACSPTRSMLLTGVDNHLNGVGNMKETIPREHLGKPGYLGALNDNVVTVATLLKDAGYHTYIAGKWHVGKTPNDLPNARGFERSIIQADSGCDNWEPHRRYLALTDKVYWFEDGKEAAMPDDYYSSEFYTDKAIEYLKSGAKDGKPFFAYVAYQANHIPLQAPKEFIAKYEGAYRNGWTALRNARHDKAIELGLIPKDTGMVTMATTHDWDALSESEKKYQARRMEVYAAMADAMDHQVGRLIAYLKETGAYDNTVFVFLSDNGAEASDPYASIFGRLWLDSQYSKDIDRLGGKGAYDFIGPSWASAAAAPLSTYKFWAGEGGIRVPLIISGVRGTRPDQIEHSFAHVNDIAPTLLDLAGVARPGGSYKGKTIESMTGASLLPVLQGKASRVHGATEPVGYELSGNAAVFKGDLKLVKNLPPIGDGAWHLYDVTHDPGETNDLRERLGDVFQAMQADYDAYASEVGVLAMPPGYEPAKQIAVNSLFNVYIPQLKAAAPKLLAVVAFLIATVLLIRRRRSDR
jgi:arylsulfatase A-like enzyme